MAENKELIEYLENFEIRLKSFVKEEVADATQEIREEFTRHTGILIEDSQHKFEILAEGIRGINEKLAREKEEHRQEHESIEKRLLLHDADISMLNQKIGLG